MPAGSTLGDRKEESAARAMRTSTERAFTLVEFLVTLTIIVALAALIATATTHSKDQAHRTVNINRLKQLGTATLLYKQTYGDYPPILSRSIVIHPQDALYDSGFVKNAQLFASRFDPTEKGLANPERESAQSRFKISDHNPFFDSWGTLRFIQERGEPYGLFADTSVGTRNGRVPVQQGLFYFVGLYHRLQSDTSVVTRTQFPIELPSATQCLLRAHYLTDMSPNEQREYCDRILSPKE